MPSIYMPLRGRVANQENYFGSARWDDVAIKGAPRFQAQIGIDDNTRADSPGVIFSLVIDGQVVDRQSLGIDRPPPGSWSAWDVDLAAYTGRTVDLELRVDQETPRLGDSALWGTPVLQFGVRE